MEKIQNHLMKDGDAGKTSSVEETPAISESIPPQAGPSGEIEEPTVLSGTSFQAHLENNYDELKRYSLQRSPREQNSFLLAQWLP